MTAVHRQYFKDDWHCGNPPNNHCNCWRTKDIERDKAMIAKLLDSIGNVIEITHQEYKADPVNEGKESRDRDIYHVSITEEKAEGFPLSNYVSVFMPNIWTLIWHGFSLTGIWTSSIKRRQTLHLDFERTGIYET